MRKETEKFVTDMLRSIYQGSEFSATTTMYDLGLDMIDIQTISQRLWAKYRRYVPDGFPDEFEANLWDMSANNIINYIDELI